MLPRKGGSHRALRWPSSPTSALWISDDLLNTAFWHFCAVSKTFKRHGNFDPGVMHSRTRLGKRRMAHLLPPPPSPSQSIAGVLQGFWEDLRSITRWPNHNIESRPWQAPRTPEVECHLENEKVLDEEDEGKEEETTIFRPQDVAVSSEAHSTVSGRRLAQDSMPLEEALQYFRASIRNSRARDATQLCADLNAAFRQHLILGLLPEQGLTLTLRDVTKRLQSAELLLQIERDTYCRALYLAIWDGIVTCKAMEPLDFGAHIMKELIFLISQLPLTLDLQLLAHDIIQVTPAKNLEHMRTELASLVVQWSKSWLSKPLLGDWVFSAASAKQAVAKAENAIMVAHKLVMAMEEGPVSTAQVHAASEAIVAASIKLDKVAQVLLESKDAINPFRRSANILAHALEFLPKHCAQLLVTACTFHIASIDPPAHATESKHHRIQRVRGYWLLAMSKMKSIDDRTLTKLWCGLFTLPRGGSGLLEQKSTSLSPQKISNIVLNQWTSQGTIKNSNIVKHQFEAILGSSRSPNTAYNHLLSALESQHENIQEHAQSLLTILSELHRYNISNPTLAPMIQKHMTKISPQDVQSLVNKISKRDRNQACQILLAYKHENPDQMDAVLNNLDYFLHEAINDPLVKSIDLWSCLAFPTFQKHPVIRCPRLTCEEKRQKEIDLINKMAMIWVRAKHRRNRIRLRNLTLCVAHLRFHGAPLPSSLSRAISDVVITESIENSKWIQQERLLWTLGIVAEAEGKEVALAARRIVHDWRAYLTERQQEEMADVARRRNVLREEWY